MIGLHRVVCVLLGIHATSTRAGNCFSDQSREPGAPTPPDVVNAIWKSCVNTLAPGDLWACEDQSVTFPTVECLMADIKLCGNLGSNNVQIVFYSYGLATQKARQFRDTLSPQGTMFNDLLGNSYTTDVLIARIDVFRLEIGQRQDLYIKRVAEAMARLSSGDVFVVIPQRWLANELPTLQRNPAFTRIISVDFSNNFHQDIDWANGPPPGQNFPLKPESTASTEAVPPVPANLLRRDSSSADSTASGLCAALLAAPQASSTSTLSSSSTPHITPPPAMVKPSCVLHGQDPDQGITQAFCLCEGTTTLSPLSVANTGHQTDSCAYKSIPATAKETVTTFASTYTSNCNACTQVGFNAPDCTSVPKCTPTKAQLIVQAGSSPVHIGTLTGTALYTSVSSALEKLCPTVAQTKSSTACQSGTVSILKIPYINDGGLDSGGSLVVKVESSSYNESSFRDAMIRSAALTAQTGSQRPKSCYNQTYASVFKREIPSNWLFGTRHRFAGYGRDHPEATAHEALLCNTVSFAGVQYYSPEWRLAAEPGAQAWIDVNWTFETEPGGDFVCDFAEDLEVGIAAVAGPILGAGDAAAEPEVQALCKDLFDQNPLCT